MEYPQVPKPWWLPWLMFVAMLVIASACGAWVVRQHSTHSAESTGILALGFSLVPLVVIGGYMRWQWYRLRGALRRTGGRLCLRCWHSLEGLRASERCCPECGEPFEINETIRKWEKKVDWT